MNFVIGIIEMRRAWRECPISSQPKCVGNGFLFSPTESTDSSVNTSKDRLLTSEIAELQARVQGLLMQNHELRQELAKTSPSRISSSRKVCHHWLLCVVGVTQILSLSSLQ